MAEHRDQEIVLAELIEWIDGKPFLQGHTFTGCVLKGPVVMYLRARVLIDQPKFDAVPAALFWELGKRTAVSGVLVVQDVTFNRCSFEHVGVTGDAEQLNSFRAQF